MPTNLFVKTRILNDGLVNFFGHLAKFFFTELLHERERQIDLLSRSQNKLPVDNLASSYKPNPCILALALKDDKFSLPLPGIAAT